MVSLPIKRFIQRIKFAAVAKPQKSIKKEVVEKSATSLYDKYPLYDPNQCYLYV